MNTPIAIEWFELWAHDYAAMKLQTQVILFGHTAYPVRRTLVKACVCGCHHACTPWRVIRGAHSSAKPWNRDISSVAQNYSPPFIRVGWYLAVLISVDIATKKRLLFALYYSCRNSDFSTWSWSTIMSSASLWNRCSGNCICFKTYWCVVGRLKWMGPGISKEVWMVMFKQFTSSGFMASDHLPYAAGWDIDYPWCKGWYTYMTANWLSFNGAEYGENVRCDRADGTHRQGASDLGDLNGEGPGSHLGLWVLDATDRWNMSFSPSCENLCGSPSWIVKSCSD